MLVGGEGAAENVCSEMKKYVPGFNWIGLSAGLAMSQIQHAIYGVLNNEIA